MPGLDQFAHRRQQLPRVLNAERLERAEDLPNGELAVARTDEARETRVRAHRAPKAAALPDQDVLGVREQRPSVDLARHICGDRQARREQRGVVQRGEAIMRRERRDQLWPKGRRNRAF